jgi:hypothetical protein
LNRPQIFFGQQRRIEGVNILRMFHDLCSQSTGSSTACSPGARVSATLSETPSGECFGAKTDVALADATLFSDGWASGALLDPRLALRSSFGRRDMANNDEVLVDERAYL